MWSLQEVCDKAKTQLANITAAMDRWGCYHPELETPNHDPASIYYGLSKADEMEIRETLKNLTLAELLTKAGPLGADYLVATKLHDVIMAAEQTTDIVPLISINPIPTAWPDANLQVPILDDFTYRGQEFASGGAIPDVALKTDIAPSIVPISFGIAPKITNDLIEDNQYELIEFHVRAAARGMGVKASDLALTVLKTATDGQGDVNGGATGDADETKYTGGTIDVLDAYVENGDDGFISNTIVVTPEAWKHSIIETYTATSARDIIPAPIAAGFDTKLATLNLDVLFSSSQVLHDSADVWGDVMTACVTIIFDRRNALLTGRKKWMQVENYSHPIEDLAGCVITARQDSVTVYDDSIAVLTET